MRHEFVNPNLHVVWVHFPMALLIIGALIELFSFMWWRSGFRAAGRWMILIGDGLPGVGSIGLADLASAHGRWAHRETVALGADRLEIYDRLR